MRAQSDAAASLLCAAREKTYVARLVDGAAFEKFKAGVDDRQKAALDDLRTVQRSKTRHADCTAGALFFVVAALTSRSFADGSLSGDKRVRVKSIRRWDGGLRPSTAALVGADRRTLTM